MERISTLCRLRRLLDLVRTRPRKILSLSEIRAYQCLKINRIPWLFVVFSFPHTGSIIIQNFMSSHVFTITCNETRLGQDRNVHLVRVGSEDIQTGHILMFRYYFQSSLDLLRDFVRLRMRSSRLSQYLNSIRWQ